jgi:hypothetical protein
MLERKAGEEPPIIWIVPWYVCAVNKLPEGTAQYKKKRSKDRISVQ